MQTIAPLAENHRARHRYLARAILLTIYTGWFLALAIGTLHYEGKPRKYSLDSAPLHSLIPHPPLTA